MLKINVEEDKIVSIYTDEDDASQFGLGYILYKTTEEILFMAISKYGEYDGLAAIHIEDIFKISQDGIYEKSISYLMNDIKKPNIDISSNISESLLTYAKKNNLMIGIELINGDSMDTIGFVKNYDKGAIIIENYDDYGNKDGEVEINFSKVKLLVCDSLNIRKIQKLATINNK